VDSPATDLQLTKRARALVEGKTTDMAAELLRVPLSYYRDPATWARERELLRHTPLAVIESARIPAPGDFVVREVLGTSLLLSRDAVGRAHVLLNHCRHRGAMVASGCGSTRRHACPYHAWTYASDGALVGLPGQEGFEGMDRAEHGLVELPTEERHGLVWAVLTAGEPIDVAAHLGPLDAELGSWGFEGYEHLTERLLHGAVSWKGALEAFAENYHFPYVHAGSIVGQNTVGNTAAFDTYGPHHRLAFPCPWITDVPEDAPPLSAMALIYWVYPNLVLGVSPVGVEIIDILPGDDPGSCSLRHGWMAAVPAGDDEATRTGYQDLYELVHAAVRDEDFALLPGCGQTMREGQFDHLVIGRNEPGVQNVVRVLAAALGLDLAPS
jgi:nitrite reductase/ring-hydroxylating ferredoxin subunit